MIVLKIDESIFVVKEDISVLEACKFVGIKIPRFCYHDILSVAGNCRMCLVNLEEDDKLIVSCVTLVESEMEIVTNDPFIEKAREEVIEFLLLNHPLDCPICDQAGECDLQDQAKNFGASHSKFRYNKTTVDDKYFGVFIKSIMTRCIHCTRCVRFSSEIAGIDFFGTLSRGGKTEIGTYAPDFFNSEISGNVVDLCPVGALTSKPYAFKARPWELKSAEGIDLSDGFGANFYVHFSESGVSRIIPKFNSEINETLISDKARYSYDAFNSHHSLSSNIAFEHFKAFQNVDLTEILNKIKKTTKDENILILVSDELSLENLGLLKKISILYPNVRVRLITSGEYTDKQNVFINFSNDIKKLNESSDVIYLLSVNPRTEAALINTRLRFLSFNDYFNIYSLGLRFNSTIKTSFLNISIEDIIKLMEGKLKKLSYSFINAINPLVIFGDSLKNRGFSSDYLTFFLKTINPSVICLCIYSKSNSAGLKYLPFKGLSSLDLIKSDNIIFLKCRESVFLKHFILTPNINKNIYWFNTHLLTYNIKNGYQVSVKNFFEETGTYLNLEFRPQRFKKIFSSKFNSRSSQSILRYIFTIKKVRSRLNAFIRSFLSRPDLFSQNSDKVYVNLLKKESHGYILISKQPLKSQIIDFFRTNYYTDFSKNMLLASREFQKWDNNFF